MNKQSKYQLTILNLLLITALVGLAVLAITNHRRHIRETESHQNQMDELQRFTKNTLNKLEWTTELINTIKRAAEHPDTDAIEIAQEIGVFQNDRHRWAREQMTKERLDPKPTAKSPATSNENGG